MSKKPSLWIEKKLKVYIIFFHYEAEEDLKKIKNKIIDSGSKGIVLHAVNDYSKKLKEIVSDFNDVMVLSIENIGYRVHINSLNRSIILIIEKNLICILMEE